MSVLVSLVSLVSLVPCVTTSCLCSCPDPLGYGIHPGIHTPHWNVIPFVDQGISELDKGDGWVCTIPRLIPHVLDGGQIGAVSGPVDGDDVRYEEVPTHSQRAASRCLVTVKCQVVLLDKGCSTRLQDLIHVLDGCRVPTKGVLNP